MSGTKLSVVIATFNRRHSLERTVPALLAQDLAPEDYELIFVVDGSTDGTFELLRGQNRVAPCEFWSRHIAVRGQRETPESPLRRVTS